MTEPILQRPRIALSGFLALRMSSIASLLRRGFQFAFLNRPDASAVYRAHSDGKKRARALTVGHTRGLR